MKRYIRYILASITLAASGTVAAGLALCPHAFKLNIFVPEHNTEATKLFEIKKQKGFLDDPHSDKTVARIHRLEGEALSPMIRGLVSAWENEQNTFRVRIINLEKNNKVIGPVPYFGRYADKKTGAKWFLTAYMGLEKREPEFSALPPDYKSWELKRDHQDIASRKRFAEQFPDYMFDRATNRGYEIKHLDRTAQPLESETFLYAPATHDHYFTDILNILPIGSYGEEFSRDLLRTSQILTDIAVKNLPTLSKDILDKNRPLVFHTVDLTTGPNSYSDFDEDYAALRGLIAGIATMHQSITLLAREKVKGLETDLDIMKAIIFGSNGEGLITELARRSPMDFIGPSGVSGIYTAGAIEYLNGKYVLGKNLKAALKIHREEISEGVDPRRRRAHNKHSQGFGCPLGYTQASGKSPLQDLAELYYSVYLKVRAHRLSQQK